MENNPFREEYLTSIFRLSQINKKITNKQLSEKLGVAPSSVTEMLRKLKAEGLVSTEKEISLTQTGEKIAKDILSKHRLWEYFLLEVLKYNWKDVHEHAQKFQSVTNSDLLDKLNEFLGYPDYCPHGSVIYINNEETIDELVKLSEAQVGDKYIIRRISDKRDLLDYAEEMNLSIGSKITILEFDKFDDTVVVKIGENKVRISPKASVDIYIKKLKNK